VASSITLLLHSSPTINQSDTASNCPYPAFLTGRCIMSQTLYSTELRSGLLGDQKSVEMNAGVPRSRRLIVSRAPRHILLLLLLCFRPSAELMMRLHEMPPLPSVSYQFHRCFNVSVFLLQTFFHVVNPRFPLSSSASHTFDVPVECLVWESNIDHLPSFSSL